MILPFSTQLNGKPTYFPEKIIKSLDVSDVEKATLNDSLAEIICPKDFEFILGSTNPFFEHHPKLHTIRKDEKDRWNPGILIDFFINTRKKNMFRFAPKIPVVSIQHIGILHYRDNPEVNIDGKYLFPNEIEQLAINDGFESVDEFFQYFNEDFHGKIIHWTNLKY